MDTPINTDQTDELLRVDPPPTCSRSSRQTLAYSKDHEGPYLEAFPIIHGKKCTAWAANDLFEDYDDALTVLAKIAVGDIGYGDAEELAKEFFELKNEQPYSYYDPDDEEENSPENAQGHPCRAADGIQIDGLSASDAPSCSGSSVR